MFMCGVWYMCLCGEGCGMCACGCGSVCGREGGVGGIKSSCEVSHHEVKMSQSVWWIILLWWNSDAQQQAV